MTDSNAVPATPKPTNIMLYIGGLMLAGILIYFSFTAMNSLGLKDRSATARVISKGYRQAGQTYITQKVGNRMLTLPQFTPEMYLLELEIQGKATSCAVAKTIYDRVTAGDQVTVVYQRKRITGGLQVLTVSP